MAGKLKFNLSLSQKINFNLSQYTKLIHYFSSLFLFIYNIFIIVHLQYCVSFRSYIIFHMTFLTRQGKKQA